MPGAQLPPLVGELNPTSLAVQPKNNTKDKIMIIFIQVGVCMAGLGGNEHGCVLLDKTA